jgi:hypothetical protein
MNMQRGYQGSLPRFERKFFESGEPFMRIGEGNLGGKAQGLVNARSVLDEQLRAEEYPQLDIEIPTTTVLTTELFDAFMERNGLYETALSGAPDDRIALAFLKADLPVEYLGDLRSLAEQTAGHPLALRSSSLLEDALAHPFAGIYETKMIPNNQSDPTARFKHLAEAVKFVYASTFFRAAAGYLRAIDKTPRDEKMAVVVQEVVGDRRGDRFYPQLSGVCRSYNYYRTGTAKPEEGVVNLALGLGKMIVDGGVSWSYSPAHPKARPPFASTGELMKNTQLRFWAVNMGKPPAYDPTKETEYLLETPLEDADYDDSLRFVASTYDPSRDRLSPGVGVKGPRVLDFAPLLDLGLWPVNSVVRRLLDLFERAAGSAVEIEFAMTFPKSNQPRARFALLQVRPMMVSREPVDLPENPGETADLLLASDRVMGNGVVDSLRDVVYVKPDVFESRLTRQIAEELDAVNRSLQQEQARKPYLLIGFGRWGSSDPWLGIPVNWGQISGAKVIVESTLEGMNVEPSQGAHFFHNISSFRVSYFTVHHESVPGIDWDWLSRQRVAGDTGLVRHIELDDPLLVKVDGRVGRGAIWYDNRN